MDNMLKVEGDFTTVHKEGMGTYGVAYYNPFPDVVPFNHPLKKLNLSAEGDESPAVETKEKKPQKPERGINWGAIGVGVIVAVALLKLSQLIKHKQ